MMHYDGIWNDLELQRLFWHKDAFACIIVTHSETIFETAMRRNSTCYDLIKGAPAILDLFKIRAVNGAFCRYLIRCFWSAEKTLKAVKLNGAFWRYFKQFGTTEIILTLSRALLWHILLRNLKLPWEETAHGLISLRGRPQSWIR